MIDVERALRPKLDRALKAKDPLARLIEEPAPGVFVFDALAPGFCERLLTETEQLESAAPNSMNKYGLVLEDVGLGAFGERLLRTIVRPLARRFYPRIGELRRCHGFVVRYTRNQRSLDLHYDQSDVTLNICLGPEFTGGRLVFRDNEGKALAKLDHVVGRAVLHLGSHLHQAQAIRSGRRSNLILWCSTS